MIRIKIICIFCISILCLFSCQKGLDELNDTSETSILSGKSNNSEEDDFIISYQTATEIAKQINNFVPSEMAIGSSGSRMEIDSIFTIHDQHNLAVMYIINYESDGYLILSADTRHNPVCALSKHGHYGVYEVPSMLIDFLDVTFENIIASRLTPPSEVSSIVRNNWKNIFSTFAHQAIIYEGCCPECPNFPKCLTQTWLGCGSPDINCDDFNPCGETHVVTKQPMMGSTWGQGCGYNDLCPNLGCADCIANLNAPTGCVATAMGQIMNFWQLNCGGANFNYGNMPLNVGNGDVAFLLKEIGDEVNMNYGCGGSGASATKARNALDNSFCFDAPQKSTYSSSSHNVIVNNLNLNQPVILDGCSTLERNFPWLWQSGTDCHMWVCEGYIKVSNQCNFTLNFYHNWGWNGAFDGYYYYTNWSAGLSGLDFQYYQDIIHNITP